MPAVRLVRSSLLPAALAAAVLCPPLAAQTAGDLDPSFGSGGVALVDVPVGGEDFSNVATDLAVQADGKLVLGGAAQRIPPDSGAERMVAVRLTRAGALDATFGTGGRVRVNAFPGDPAGYWNGQVAIGPAGEISLLNGASYGGGAVGWVLARLRPTGALETGFGGGGFVGYLSDAVGVGDVVALADGKVLGPSNLAATVAADASLLYARNLLNLLMLLWKEGKLSVPEDDEVVAGTLLTHAGEIKAPGVAALLSDTAVRA